VDITSIWNVFFGGKLEDESANIISVHIGNINKWLQIRDGFIFLGKWQKSGWNEHVTLTKLGFMYRSKNFGKINHFGTLSVSVIVMKSWGFTSYLFFFEAILLLLLMIFWTITYTIKPKNCLQKQYPTLLILSETLCNQWNWSSWTQCRLMLEIINYTSINTSTNKQYKPNICTVTFPYLLCTSFIC